MTSLTYLCVVYCHLNSEQRSRTTRQEIFYILCFIEYAKCVIFFILSTGANAIVICGSAYKSSFFFNNMVVSAVLVSVILQNTGGAL